MLVVNQNWINFSFNIVFEVKTIIVQVLLLNLTNTFLSFSLYVFYIFLGILGLFFVFSKFRG
jgi:hypothetical protein